MINKKKIIITTLACSLLCAASFSTAYALYVTTPENIVFGIEGHIDAEYTITYHLPTGINNEFSENTVSVDEGANLYTALNAYTSDIGNYKFMDWRLSKDHFRNDDENKDPISNSTTVTNDIEVYAKFAERNVAYFYNSSEESHNYISSSQAEIAIEANTLYYGDHIYSYNGVEGHSINLYKDSGLYHLTRESDTLWSVKRIIAISVEEVSSWWFSDDANTYLYCFINQYNNHWEPQVAVSNENQKVKIELNQAYLNINNFIVVRNASNSATFEGAFNQTIDLSIEEYSSSKYCITIYDSETDGKKDCEWTTF